MKKYQDQFDIGKMAHCLQLSRSNYYHFRNRKASRRALENQHLTKKIKQIYEDSRETYGSPRIYKELKKLAEPCSRRRVAKLMKEAGLEARSYRLWKGTTRSKEEQFFAPNILDQDFRAEAPNKVWMADISQISTEEGWLYIAVILDLFSRRVIGLSMAERMKNALVIKALEQALLHRQPQGDLLHHSDRGSQYASEGFLKKTKEHGICLSMSNKGHCYDNAVVESFFHSLKTEHVHFCQFKTREEAKDSIFEYIELFYNKQRSHSSLGYVSPQEFETKWNKQNNSRS